MAKTVRPKKEITSEEMLDEAVVNDDSVLVTKTEVDDTVILNKVAEPVLDIEYDDIKELPPHVDVKPDMIEAKKKLGMINGFVVNCNAVRLREGANIRTSILNILKVGTEVKVNLDNSTENFYEVTCDGLIGFCVKEFIKVG